MKPLLSVLIGLQIMSPTPSAEELRTDCENSIWQVEAPWLCTHVYNLRKYHPMYDWIQHPPP